MIVRHSSYFRRSDKTYVRRFLCRGCKKTISTAYFELCFRQKKRHLNELVMSRYCSLESIRRIARELRIHRITVERKIEFLVEQAFWEFKKDLYKRPKATDVYFDDLETFEHTKLKPLSVIAAVDERRFILGFRVAVMPCTGLIAKKSIEKYGKRPDLRAKSREDLFIELKDFIHPQATFKSDSNPHYPKALRKHFPEATHVAFKGRRGRPHGQGELKVGPDPLFKINHTFAMFRANVNRLIRKTWCTTKKLEKLEGHLLLYAHYHNSKLVP